MKASIFLEELNCKNCIAKISAELSKIKEINNILPNGEKMKISFNYESENAALKVVELLNYFRHNKKECTREFKIG
jgi:copper chaperone CopZ